ncbi:MAG: adenylate/guanylate cyclase domain-containing protein [Nitrosomonadales bacterium]|nr:adenylate/guanylate cyclase domain-containing protein [Nitrosomonadales bacterium]
MTRSIEEIKSEIISAQKTGDYLREYDLAQAALEFNPHDEFLQHCSVLALSRCNAKQRALDSFYSYRLQLSSNEYVRALEPRILKDLAFQSLEKEQPFQNMDREKFRTAAVSYHQEFGKSGSHYAAVNAAILYMFSGDREQAVELAGAAIEMARKDRGPKFFPQISRAEACILLRRPDVAAEFIAEAAKHKEINLLTRARARNQLMLICSYMVMDAGLEFDPAILDPLLPETVIHYCGHIFDQSRKLDEAAERRISNQIEDRIAGNHCAIAYGSLAAGADIMFAEAILKRGGELNVWLPFGKESFCEELVRPYGERWVQRFHDCIGKAHTVSCATESDYLGESSLFNFCADVAMGMAIMRAGSLYAKVMQLAVWDQIATSQRSGTYTNIAKWKELGHHTEVIPAPARLPEQTPRKYHGEHPEYRREPHAILFADVRGFSKLCDRDILWYFNVLQPELAKVIGKFRAEIQHLDTWGDAIFLVMEKASTAARIALELNNAIAAIDQSGLDIDAPLLMRIGLHFGPVYKVYDHLMQSHTYASNDVNKTARIEPVTPPGEIFGTEPFVAMLELEGEGWAGFDYAGTIPSAKDFGAFRMFHVRPKHAAPVLMCSIE